MKKTRLLINLVVAITVISCQGFYDYSKIGDVYRIPLIKPIEARSNSQGESWHLDMPYRSLRDLNEVSNISLIGVSDSIIVVYTDRIYVPSLSRMTEAWFIINTKRKEELMFDKKMDFDLALFELNKDGMPLFKINDVFKEFNDNRHLPKSWIH